jgi:hypothetical protein
VWHGNITGVEVGESWLLRSGDAAVWKLLTFNAEFLPSELPRRDAVWLSTGVLKHDIQHNAAHPSALMGIRLVIVLARHIRCVRRDANPPKCRNVFAAKIKVD